MQKYCKAYLLEEVRQYPQWEENKQYVAKDQQVCYLWDDFTVVTSPIRKESIIFDRVSSEWITFCQTMLKFQIPSDLLYAYQAKDQDS